jgi:predicted O-linked N-acetylglucosamine transferase (SPINDLY family)
MGVPVVTMIGRTVTNRATWSALNNLQLPELAARDEEEFIRMVSALANDIPRLTELRATMRDRMRNSPLTDAPRFAHSIESIYRDLWRRWCDSRTRDAAPR